MGKGVATAVSNVNDRIASKLIGMDPTDQKGIDDAMLAIDGTENKARYTRDHAEIWTRSETGRSAPRSGLGVISARSRRDLGIISA